MWGICPTGVANQLNIIDGYQVTMNGVRESIAEATLSLAKFAKTMREIEWEYFDYLQDKISQITSESKFLRELLGEDNLFDNGKLTDAGRAALGLRAMDYNVYMAQADKYAEEIRNIDRELANDPYNKDLIARREELLKLQQDSILAAEAEKDAILDLVRNGIEEQLSALKKLIEAYKDALDSAKDLYDYRNKIADQTSEIASLQKQISAYAGDDSEETKATLQRLNDQLIKAQKELEQTEYDKYISDQKKLLDNLYTEYENLLNQRFDDTNALLSEVIDMVNQNSDVISETLYMVGDSVGYTLTDDMQTIWNTATTSLTNVVSMYGDNFLSQLTTTNAALNNIAMLVQSMQDYGNTWSNDWIGGVNNSYVPDISGWTPSNNTGYNDDGDIEYILDYPAPSPSPTPSPAPAKPITVGGRINAGSSLIYSRSDKSDGGITQYYKNDPIYTVLEQLTNKYGETMLKVRYHKLSSGVTGWFRKNDVQAYKKGGMNTVTGLAWLDGTSSNPEAVLNAQQTKQFMGLREAMDKLASQGLDLSKESGVSERILGKLIGGGRAEISPIGGSYGGVTQEVSITIPIERVMDYNDFMNQLSQDKRAERMLDTLLLGKTTGKNSLTKNKYKWG